MYIWETNKIIMNTKELRQGNIIQFNEDGTLAVVKGIDADSLGLTVHFIGGDEIWIEANQFSGVAVTKDNLFFIGCFQTEGNETLVNVPDYIKQKCTGDNGFKCPTFFFNKREDINSWMDCQTRVCVKYLHEVQNLVYWLTREEIPNA